jgi:hypothetical protein
MHSVVIVKTGYEGIAADVVYWLRVLHWHGTACHRAVICLMEIDQGSRKQMIMIIFKTGKKAGCRTMTMLCCVV